MPSLLPLALLLLSWPEPQPPAPGAITPEQIVSALEDALTRAIAKAEPSVVAIAREKSENEETTAIRGRDGGGPRNAFDRRLMPSPFDPVGSGDTLSFDYGAGVVIGDKGQILTAYHVVKGAATLRVRAAGKQEFLAEIIAADPRSDLAVIVPRENGTPAPKLTPIPLGDADVLRKGSFLVALGNPYNAARDGQPSSSWGILSNIARRLSPSFEEQARQELALRHYPTLLQLDSKLNIGMSGGAVINLKGELVGITTGAANAAGFDAQAGYAIPLDKLGRQVIDRLKQGKEYEYGFLGIRLDTQGWTNRVASADPGSPAFDGGVQVNDLIVAVGGRPVTDADSLIVAINTVPAGEPVIIKINRAGAPVERTVHLAKLRVRAPVIATNRDPSWRGLRVDYTSTLANTTFTPELMEAMSRKGVVVSEVESGSNAEKAGLKKDQVITRVEGQPVPNPREFARIVSGLKGPVRLETADGPVTVK